MTGTDSPGLQGLTARGWAALLVLCAAVFLDALDVSMVGVALPSIRADLHMSTSSLQWVVSAYVLGYGGFLLLGGRAADLFGRRRVFLVALGIFVVASALGGLATDPTVLVATRFVKGLSAAFTAPAAFSIITTTFAEGPARNKALSVYTATGGDRLLVRARLRRAADRGSAGGWAFLIPAPVALLTLLAAVRLVPATPRPALRSRIDVGGAVSLTAAMLLLVYTLVEAPTAGWGSGAHARLARRRRDHPRRIRRARAADAGAARSGSASSARARWCARTSPPSCWRAGSGSSSSRRSTSSSCAAGRLSRRGSRSSRRACSSRHSRRASRR